MKDVIGKFSEDALLKEMGERATEGLREWESKVVEECFPPNGSVLDIGCGGGRSAIAFAELGCELSAVDVDDFTLPHKSRQAQHNRVSELQQQTEGSVPCISPIIF
jgi:ribosomal protein L11 methylase PrmA